VTRIYIERSGVLLLDKPGGMSTYDVLRQLQRSFRFGRVGHTGTLDPLATGLVVACLNEATKLVPYLSEGHKTYLCTMKLGQRTDTLDADGRVVAEAPVPELQPDDIQRVFERFTGAITQVPPDYSAVKHLGKPLYEYARDGEAPRKEPRPAFVHALTLRGGAGDSWQFEAVVSKGTYIRVLVDDLGLAMGTLAHVAALRRTVNGGFSVEQARRVADLVDESALVAALIPPDRALQALPTRQLEATEATRFLNGGFCAPPPAAVPGCTLRVLGPDGAFLGIGRVAVLEGAPKLKPERLLHL